jgi:hypothetical protein
MSDHPQKKYCENCKEETMHMMSGTGKKGACEVCGKEL